MEKTLEKQKITQRLARRILRLRGWKLEDRLPPFKKFVVLAAPHTSNTDFVYMLLLQYSLGIKLHWIGKDTIFRWPAAGLFRMLGGVPVNRRSRNNFVRQITEEFNQREDFILLIAPEGTRGRSEYWKTGFYYIALGAGVPIVLAFIDYQTHVLGIGSTLFPAGDLKADFELIREFYTDKTGRYPHKQGDIRLAPSSRVVDTGL